MPTNTDLVTDLPADFAVFGQAVDTSLADLKGGTTGQILAKTSATDMDFTWIANDQGDITGVTAGTGITVTSPTGPVPTVSINTAVTADLTTSQTLTNKTLTSPVLTTPSISNINAKGDILVGTADNTLGVITAGNNGESLVADSSTSTGLRYNSNFAAGKNKVLNGDFYINQRNFTSVTTSGTYTFDRFYTDFLGGTCTFTPQSFTAGAAPVAGYEGKTYIQAAISGQTGSNYASYNTRIEDVRTLAGQTATLSFWAKVSSGTPSIYTTLTQRFGTGGSPSSAVVTTNANQALTTSWARYSINISVPSISGKTIGTDANTSSIEIDFMLSNGAASIGLNNVTFSIWGVQLEAGSVATAFQTATGTLGGELALCQRYYWRQTGPGVYARIAGSGIGNTTTQANFVPTFPVTMRTVPTSVDFSTLLLYDTVNLTAVTSLVISASSSTLNSIELIAGVASGLTAFRPYMLANNNNAAGYLGLSAEL